jgi:hypothetical protein
MIDERRVFMVGRGQNPELVICANYKFRALPCSASNVLVNKAKSRALNAHKIAFLSPLRFNPSRVNE